MGKRVIPPPPEPEPIPVEQYMQWNWEPVVEELPEGDFRLTVPPITDFEVFGATEGDLIDWREMLKSHLAGYIAVGKRIPPLYHPIEEYNKRGNACI